MSRAQVEGWIKTLPVEHRGKAREALADCWADAFYTGAAKLPNKNPYDLPLAEHIEATAKKPNR